MVINLGDTFNDHAVIRSEISGLFKKHIEDVLSLCSDYRYVLGNHDMYKPNDSTYHALIPFKSISGFKVYDTATVEDGFHFIPYIPDIKDFPKTQSRICFAHQTFRGATFGQMIAQEDCVEVSDLDCELMISGHIHVRQLLDNKVYYPGTPFSQSASDIDEIKGVSILDTEDLSIDFIESPLPQWKSLHVVADRVSKNIDYIEENSNDKDVWVVKLHGKKLDIKSIIESSRIQKLKKNRDFRFRPNFTDSNKSRIKTISAENVDSVVQSYIDKVYTGSLDRQKLKNILSDYLK